VVPAMFVALVMPEVPGSALVWLGFNCLLWPEERFSSVLWLFWLQER